MVLVGFLFLGGIFILSFAAGLSQQQIISILASILLKKISFYFSF
jgi:hypothetical protein